MSKASSSLSEWQRLYKLADQFKAIKCWEYMYDSDIFGVYDPSSCKIGYCCVLGNRCEVFALMVYNGSKGLDVVLRMQRGEHPDGDLRHSQDCLSISFEDRGILEKQDINVIKQLGLKFRGKNSWIMFREYEPGYEPWFIDKNDVKFLNVVIEQAIDVVLRFKDNKNIIPPLDDELFLTRVPIENVKKIKWKDKMLKLEPIKPSIVKKKDYLIDDFTIRRIIQESERLNLVLELDYFYSPCPVQESPDARPYFPYIFLFVDRDLEAVIANHVFKHDSYAPGLIYKVVKYIDESGEIPMEISVSKKDVYFLLKELAKKLKIELKLVNRLHVIENFKERLFGFAHQEATFI